MPFQKDVEDAFRQRRSYFFQLRLVQQPAGLDQGNGDQGVQSAENFIITGRLRPQVSKGQQLPFYFFQRPVIFPDQVVASLKIALFADSVDCGKQRQTLPG